jgi:hypothetical protein
MAVFSLKNMFMRVAQELTGYAKAGDIIRQITSKNHPITIPSFTGMYVKGWELLETNPCQKIESILSP